MSQRQFRAALLDPDLPVPAGLMDGDGRPAGRRFSVYRNNVAGSLTDALRQSFPVLVKLLGDEFFTAMAGVFLRAHPPTSRLMMFYGAEMADFLRTFPPAAEWPYLPDIARLEQALRHSYHAADTARVSAERLAALSPDAFMGARLTLAPSLRLIASDWPIHAIWHANTQSDAPAPTENAEAVLILRPDFDPMPHLLPNRGAAFVAGLMGQLSVTQALARVPDDFDPGPTLSLLLQGGAVTDVAGPR